MFSVPTLHGNLSKQVFFPFSNLQLNGSVYAQVSDSDYFYFGGNFSTVTDIGNIKSRYATVLDKATASFPSTFLRSYFSGTGSFNCSVVDGDYVYVGCSSIYNEVSVLGVAKIHIESGQLETSFKVSSGLSNIYSLAIDGDALYVGGTISLYNSKTRQGLIKINKNTGQEIDADGTGFSTTSGFNGNVYSIKVDGDNLYIGGDFTTYKGVGRQRIAKINKNTAVLDTDFNTASGFSTSGALVNSMIIDGNNLYVGGYFTTYKTKTRQHIVKIDKTTALEVDVDTNGFSITNAFGSGGQVNCMALDGGNLYIGGSFTTYKGLTRQRIVKIDKTTAVEVDADTNGFSTTSGFNSTVNSIIIDSDNLYAGGSFTSYKGQTRQRIAKIYKTNAAEVDLSGTGFSTTTGFSNTVRAISSYNDKIYVSGDFANYKSDNTLTGMNGLLKISKRGSISNSFNSSISSNNGLSAGYSVYSILLDGDDMYVGGSFVSYKTKTRSCLIKINKNTAAEIDIDGNGFSITNGFNVDVRSIQVDGNNLYVGGSFLSYKGITQRYVAKLDKNTATLLTTSAEDILFNRNTPNSNVYSLVVDPNSVYLSGGFTNITNDLTSKSRYQALIDKENASLVSSVSRSFFNGSVSCSVVDGDYIYVGGSFTTYNDTFINRIAKIHIPTGALDSVFNPGVAFNSTVFSMIIDGNNLYVGGGFTTYKGLTRQCIVKIDKTTAAEIDADGTGFSTTSGFNDIVYSMVIDGNNLYAGGQFTYYKSNARNKIVKINKTTAAEVDTSNTGFSTSSGFNNSVRSLSIVDEKLYIGGNFTTYKSITNLSGFYKINLSLKNISLFDSSVACSVIDGNYIYIGGSFSTYNGIARNKIAKINITTGELDSVFDPGLGFNSGVTSIILDGNNLYVGGNFNTYKGITRQFIAKIDKTTAAEVDADGTGFSTTSGFDSGVSSMILDGNNLYVGGYFVTYKTKTRQGIVKINKTTAAEVDADGTGFSTTSGFDASGISAEIYSMILDGNNLYVSGYFTTYKTKNRRYIAKIDKTTAAEVDADGTGFSATWNLSSGFNSQVNSMIIDGNNLYAGGQFTTYKGLTRQNIVKIDKTTAAEVDVDGTGFSTTSGFNSFVYSMAIDGNTLYAGGNFTTYKGLTRQRIVKINKTTAAEVDADGTGFSTTSGFSNAVYSIAIDTGSAYVGGLFNTYKSYDNISGFVKIDKNNSNPFSVSSINTKNYKILKEDISLTSTQGVVYDTKINSDSIYIAGDFDVVGNAVESKSFKGTIVNKTSGELLPSLIRSNFTNSNEYSNGTEEIYCCAMDENHAYVGGVFNYYNGDYVGNIVKINLIDGTRDTNFVLNFQSGIGGITSVSSIILDGDYIYVCGNFQYANTSGGSYAAKGIIKVSKTSGAVDYNFNTLTGFDSGFGTPYYLNFDSNYIYVGGVFTRYKNTQVENFIKINKTTAEYVTDDTSKNVFLLNSSSTQGVRAIDTDNDSIYIGGDFQYTDTLNNIKTLRGACLSIDTLSTDYSKTKSTISNIAFNGTVTCSVIDGSDLYVGGYFTMYNGVVRNKIAKINLTTGALDTTFDPGDGFGTSSSYKINSIIVDGSNLYVGGWFASYKGKSRGGLVKISKITAEEIDTDNTGFSVTSSNSFTASGTTAEIYSIILDGTNLYIGGFFDTYKGLTRQNIVKINKTTAAEVDTNGTGFSTTSGFNGPVSCMVLDGNNLYVGGFFSAYKSISRYFIAKIDKTTAAEVDASLSGFSTGSAFNNYVFSMVLDGSNLYVGGAFSAYKGSVRYGLVKINKTNATEVDAIGAGFSTDLGFGNSYIYSMTIDGNNLYVGGSFTTYKGLTRQRIIKINKATAAEVDTNGTGFSTTTGFSNMVNTLSLSSTNLFVGGSFSVYKPIVDFNVNKSNIVKINKTTGILNSSFNINSFTSPVYDIKNKDNDLYVAYSSGIRQINKTTASNIYDIYTGDKVNKITADNSYVYAVGKFWTAGSTSVRNIVKINRTGFVVDTVFNNNNGLRCGIGYAIDVNSTVLYAGGSFINYGKSERIVKINKTNETMDVYFNTNSGFNGIVYSMAIDGSNLYAGGNFTTYKGLTRERIVKINKATAAEVDPNGTGFSIISGFANTVNTLSLSSYGLSVGGSFLSYKEDSGSRLYAAKINKTTGKLDSIFDTSSLAGGFNSTVYSMTLDGNSLFISGLFTTYKGLTRQRIAKIDRTTALEVDADNTGFSTASGFNNNVHSMIIDGNDIYLGGSFTTYKGSLARGIVKIDKTTAALNSSFDTSVGFNSSSTVWSIATDNDKLYVGGSFTSYNNQTISNYVFIDKKNALIYSKRVSLGGNS